MCLIKLVQRQHEIKTASKSLYKQFSPVRNDTLKTLHNKKTLPFFACDICINDSTRRRVCQIHSIPRFVENPGTDPLLHNDDRKFGSKNKKKLETHTILAK